MDHEMIKCEVANFHRQTSDVYAYLLMVQGSLFSWITLWNLWHAEHFCSLNLSSISYSFWNKERKVLKFWKFDEKRAITPR